MKRYLNTFRRVFPGIHRITAILVLCVGFITIFYAVAADQDFFLRDSVVQFDQAVHDVVLIQRGDTRSAFFLFFTYLGNWEIITSIALVVLILMALWRKIRAAGMFIATLAIGQSLSLLFKYLLTRSRPNSLHALIDQGGHSFPSGHALGAVIFYGMLAYFAITLLKRHWQHIVITLSGILLIGLIGVSRLYLGVHWFSDVIAGWTLGGTLLILFIVFFENRKELFPINEHPPLIKTSLLIPVGLILALAEAAFVLWYYFSNPLK